jgi:hypothetical protein
MWSNSYALTSVDKSRGKLGSVTKSNVPRNKKERKSLPAVTLCSGQYRETQLCEVGKVERVAVVAMRPDETVCSPRAM